MQGYSKGARTPSEARSDALPNMENASRAELQLTLEQLARANGGSPFSIVSRRGS